MPGIPLKVRVLAAGGEFHVVAAAPIDAGAPILEIDGEVVGRPDRYSLQVDDALHVTVPASLAGDVDAIRERHPWRFLNHSCDPNALVRGRRLLALRPIREAEEITFDYNTTEWEMDSPFTCRCGACGGRRIAGFRHLPDEERARLFPTLANHLRRRLR